MSSQRSTNTVPAAPRARVLLLVAALVALGVGLRLRYLSEGTLFIDEGESSINALTILEHGVPTDSYLGLPLFENTLTEPWPESAEYEFRDSSYANGLAVYHGWLPLYAIAASLALHGIQPDVADGRMAVRHTDAELFRRIRAARLPSVAFGALFLVAIFLLGRELFGVEAGLCALLAAALAPRCVWIAQQARYYSAGLALATLAALLALRAARLGRWRDFAGAGLAFAFLFHTSSLAFAIALASAIVLLPRALRHERALQKLGTFVGILALGLVPWMLWTGFWSNTGRIPMARAQLDFPGDYLAYLWSPDVVVSAASLVAILVALRRRAGRSAHAREQLAELWTPVAFVAWWLVVAYFGFQALVPAASCSMARLTHQLVAPSIVMGSMALAALARVVAPRRSIAVSVGACALLLVATGNVFRWQRRNPVETAAVLELVDHLRGLQLAPDARVYSLPYQHFSLTYYTGLPVQSIAPVRAEFFARHRGEVVILETVQRSPTPPPALVVRVAERQGIELSEAEAVTLAPRLHRRLNEEALASLVSTLEPPVARLEERLEQLLPALEDELERSGVGAFDYASDNPAMFGGMAPMRLANFWPQFFWRFVAPETRTGAGLNYAERRRTGRATMMDSSWAVIRCPASVPGEPGHEG